MIIQSRHELSPSRLAKKMRQEKLIFDLLKVRIISEGEEVAEIVEDFPGFNGEDEKYGEGRYGKFFKSINNIS